MVQESSSSAESYESGSSDSSDEHEDSEKRDQLAHRVGVLAFEGSLTPSTWNEHSILQLLKELGLLYHTRRQVDDGAKLVGLYGVP